MMPKAEEAARQVIHSWILYGPKRVNQFDPDSMPSGILTEVAGGVLAAMLNHDVRDLGGLVTYFGDAPQSVRDELIEAAQGFAPMPEDCRPALEKLREFAKVRKTFFLAHRLSDCFAAGDDPAEILKEITVLEATSTSASESLVDKLTARSFNFDVHPSKPIPLLEICGMPLATPGNIMNIQALPKAGKSAVMESQIAAIFNGKRQGPDTLGFTAENPQGKALIHFDTEQSRYDHDALVRRSIRRAGIERTPDWFVSYSLADLDIRDRRLALRHAMVEAAASHGGVFAVMIDGIADLCGDPNDSEESFDLVHELHALAITHDCTIITVLHENPGSESGKTRGHLGSQLERKAETNLRLAKDGNGVTTVWAERARHCYLPRDQGPCFSWDDQAGMHTSCGTAGEIKSAATREKMQDEAEKSFGSKESLRHSDLITAIETELHLKERASKLRIQKWATEGIIRKDEFGNYTLTDS